MKATSLFLVLGSALALMACSESKKSTGENHHGEFTLDTAIVDYKSKNPQTVFFDLSNDSMTSVPLHSWDLAIHTMTGAIRTNGGLYGAGVLVYQTKETDIDADLSTLEDSVTGIQTANFNPLLNEIGRDASGSDTVYLIKDAAGNLFKIKFESFGIQGKYTLQLAQGLDTEADALSGSITTAQGYLWLDLSAGKDVSATFPASADWDLCFTRGLEQKQYAGPGVDSMVIAQSVIFLNADAGVAGSISEESDFDAIMDLEETDFTETFDFIGAGWYDANYDPQTHISNPTVKDQVYLIKTGDDESYKVQFLSFFGPAQESFVTVFKYAVVE